MADRPLPTCPHGCRRRLRWVDDAWFCSTCRSEFHGKCGSDGCENSARPGEGYCTRHEDRATYERYAREACEGEVKRLRLELGRRIAEEHTRLHLSDDIGMWWRVTGDRLELDLIHPDPEDGWTYIPPRVGGEASDG